MKLKLSFRPLQRVTLLSLTLCLTFVVLNFCSAADSTTAKPAAAAKSDLVPLDLKLPPPAFKGTPKDIPLSSYVEPLSHKPRPPMLTPPGLKTLAPGKKLPCSHQHAGAHML